MRLLPFFYSHPVWLSNVQCNSNQTGHILRCQYDFNIITEHDDDWYLTCGKYCTISTNQFKVSKVLRLIFNKGGGEKG